MILKYTHRRLGERSRWKTRRQHGIPLPRIARYTTVWVYKIILSTENHPINITKFEIPQVIAGEKPVKFDWMIVVIHYSHYITF
jgi:hypothetical protein